MHADEAGGEGGGVNLVQVKILKSELEQFLWLAQVSAKKVKNKSVIRGQYQIPDGWMNEWKCLDRKSKISPANMVE